MRSFIAELFLLKVLASKAICRCIDILLTANDDFSLDCLCTLLSTCGKQLEENLRKKVTYSRTRIHLKFILLIPLFSNREAKPWISTSAALISSPYTTKNSTSAMKSLTKPVVWLLCAR